MNILELLSEWGAYLGVLIGVLGPNFAAYWRSKDTCGPKERAYLFKCNVLTVPIVTVALLGLAVVLEHVLPPPYHRSSFLLVVFLILAPYLWISTVIANRRLVRIRAEDSQHTGVDPMTSAESPASPSPGTSTCGSQSRAGTIAGVVFWMIMGALVFNGLTTKKLPQQGLRITNTGSESVDIRKLARWSWQEEEWTLPPGETFIGKFAPGEHFRFARSDQAPPKPGTTPPASHLGPRFEGPDGKAFLPTRSYLWGEPPLHQNADGSGTILLRHVDRTAEVRVNEDGKIEFEFTDL